MKQRTWFSRLPQALAHRLYPLVRYTSLMRALELRFMGSWLRRAEGMRVLDVGCGHGYYSLDPPRRGAAFVGCDLDLPSLANAQQIAQDLGEDQALFLVANGELLPLPDQTFDLVVCNCVLEHIADDRAALEAMARSLRIGGVLYLTVDNAEHNLVLGFLERLSPAIKKRLLWPEVASAPTVSAGLDARLENLYAVLRRYHSEDLANTLTGLGLTVLDHRPYLTGVGGAHYEAFHAVRVLDPTRSLGRVLYMLSSLLLYPLAAWSDNRRDVLGHGLFIVARKEEVTGP